MNESAINALPIYQRPELQSSHLDPFDFISLIAVVSSQVDQDNQLLLLLHKHVVVFDTVEGSRMLAKEKEEAKELELQNNRERVKKFMMEYCEVLGEEEAIAFLIVCNEELLIG